MSIDSILSQLGLKERYICNADTDFHFWDEQDFKYYNSVDYQNSQQKEDDEFYRMHESVLMHRNTGIRFSLLSSENYVGDEVTYTLCAPFIITVDRIRKYLTNLDIENGVCYTEDGVIELNQIDKN
jgi:hypothetical protein